MHPKPGRVLSRYLSQQPGSQLPEARTVEAYLADMCGEHSAEIFVLVQAQRQRIPEALQSAENTAANRRRLAQRLQRQCAFEESAALWAVETWADALRLAPRQTLWDRLLRQWQNLNFSRLRPERISGRDSVQYRRIWFTLRRTVSRLPPVAMSLLVVAVAVMTLAGIDRVMALFPDGDQSLLWEDPSGARAAMRARERLPMPAQVLIDAELLNVRAEPTLNAEILGSIGPRGVQVRVEEMDETAQWGRIESPFAGWISTEYVIFNAGPAPLRLRPAVGSIDTAGLPVLERPTVDAQVLGTLAAGSRVEEIGVTPDGVWTLIGWPLAGWIESRHIGQKE